MKNILIQVLLIFSDLINDNQMVNLCHYLRNLYLAKASAKAQRETKKQVFIGLVSLFKLKLSNYIKSFLR